MGFPLIFYGLDEPHRMVCACEFGAVFVLTCPVLGTGRFYCGQENGLTANSKPLAVVPRIG
jgi:hypothetical protein